MKKFTATCTCGDKFTVQGADKKAAMEELKKIMTPEKIAEHMAQKHAGQPVPMPEQAYAMMEQTMVEEMETTPPAAN